MNVISLCRALARHPWRECRVKSTAWVGGVALLVSVTMSHVLNRDLLDQFGSASELMSRQRAAVDAHDQAVAAVLELHRALLRAADGQADAAIRPQLEQVGAALQLLTSGMEAIPEFASQPTYLRTVALLRGLPSALPSVDDGSAGRSVPQAMLDRSFQATAQLVTLGRELHRHNDVEMQRRQTALITLRARTLWLMYLLCGTFSLTMAMAAHWVRLGRREVRIRREADAARQEAVSAGELAAAASRDKSKFLGMLSHELLTPLQSIVSSMDIIESKGRVDVGDPVFMRLREGALALRARMSDLVDFAKMSAGRLAVSPRKFRIDRLVEDVIADHEEAVVRKDLDIHWESGPDLGRPILTDPRRVRQILDNLVSNAIKYTARGGVTIEAELSSGGDRLSLEVRDTGVGIAPEVLEHIFDPFYRVASSAQLAEGSGLGLAVVRSLIELLQGQIHVESVLGEGTRFRVEIPLASAPPAVEAPALPPSFPLAVLVVDDAHDARTVVAQAVRSLGCTPTEAGSGREALRALAERRYDVVLLDIELPDLSGFDVIRQVRQGDGPNRDAYFVMLSASHENDDNLVALFNDRADKPVEIGRLKAVLQQVG